MEFILFMIVYLLAIVRSVLREINKEKKRR